MILLVTGAAGMLGGAVVEAGRARGHDLLAADRAALDVTNVDAVSRFVASARPDVIIQCAGYTRVDDAEAEEEVALAVNARATEYVARAANAVGACLLYPSTDYVFDGTARAPYEPGDPTAPINAYGRSKLAGEIAVRQAHRHLVVRTSWLYGPGGGNFVATILQRARTGAPLRVVDDQTGSPTWTRDLANTMLDLIEAEAATGTYHACNAGTTTWHGFAAATLEVAGIMASLTPVETTEFPRPAKRPVYSVLDCRSTERIVGAMRPWRLALEDAIAEGL